MKIALLALIASLLTLVPSADAAVGTLRLETVDLGVRYGDTPPEGRSAGDDTVWIKRVVRRSDLVPIGNHTLICTYLGHGGAFGSGISDCRGTFNLPLGKLRVAGQRRSANRYALAVTGGTGYYVGSRGVMISERLGPGRDKINIFLK
jgi:hypothetical protein